GRRARHVLLGAAGEPLGDQGVGHAQQQHAGEQEQAAVDQRQPGADGQPGEPGWRHGIRYPTPASVTTTGGPPSLRRSLRTVIRTAWVNGSACSSHAFSNSCSAETTPPSARSSSASTANSLRDSGTYRPLRYTSRRCGSRRIPARCRIGGAAGRARRPSATTRAASSANANGLGRQGGGPGGGRG